MEIVDYPARKRKILRNFKIILPKFHLILPKSYFAPPWGNSVCSLSLPNLLPGRVTAVGTHGTSNLCRDALRLDTPERPYNRYSSAGSTTDALLLYTEPCLPVDRGGTARGSLV